MRRIIMHIKRLALGAALSGAAIAATPALANAASVCTYTPPSGLALARVDVFDGSGNSQLVVRRSGQFIAISDASSAMVCNSGGIAATVTNTDQIVVHGTAVGEAFPFVIDESNGAFAPGKTPEPSGDSEIEIIVQNNGAAYQDLITKGTSGPDTMRVTAGGGVALGFDDDVDIRATNPVPNYMELDGGGGNDFLSGRGTSLTAPSTTHVELLGGDGDDFLSGGPLADDLVFGQAGNDRLFSVDGQSDQVSGGPGFDTATIDTIDSSGSDLEQVNQVTVGRLKLTPTAVKARVGRAAKVTLAWKHPKSWKQLRALQLTANDAGNVVGLIQVDPAQGRISGHGALRATSRSTVIHHGKWVTARIWLRPSQRLAGRILRLAVQATDVHGHQQLEPLAGTLTVAK